MISTKKRSLNEIRQTKDSFYEVPNLNKKCVAEEVIEAYLNHSGAPNEISKENVNDFIKFLNMNRYKITQE